MKNILIFGATGATGKEVLRLALENGYKVTAVVRNKKMIEIEHSRLTIVEGNVLESSSYEAVMAGIEGVISCLGQGTSTQATELYSKGINNIILTMQSAKVRRLLCISAGALEINDDMGLLVKTLTKFVIQRIFKEPYQDMRVMEKIIENSDTDWTIVRPPMLTNERFRSNYRISIGGHIKRPFRISRKALADYMVRSLTDTTTFKKKVEVSY